MHSRYIKNLTNLITSSQQELLLTKHIGVIGCGGNGGYIIEFLCRLGIKELSIWDGDNFESTNLNRQIYCNINTLNKNKAQVAVIKAQEINPDIIYHVHDHYFADKFSDLQEIKKCDLIFLCADIDHNWKKQRLMLSLILADNIPMIECFVNEIGAFSMFFNKDRIIEFKRYTDEQTIHINNIESVSQPAFLCAMSASLGINMMIQYFKNNLINFNQKVLI